MITNLKKGFMSKFYIKNMLLLLLAWMVTSCGSGDGPGSTAVEMFKKICAKNDYSIMLEYVAPESSPLIAMSLNMLKIEGAPKDNKMCKQEIKVVSEKISENTAIVTLAGNDPMNWKKIDGKWKFFVKK